MDLITQARYANMTRVISVSATVLLLTYFWFSRRNHKLPPSPLRAWPIVGNLLQLDPDPREQFARFRKQCGDIFSIYMGPSHVVVLNGLDVVNEAFVKQGNDFSDRATTFLDIATGFVNKGLVSSNGDIWKEHRALSISVLRKFGSKKNILAERIQDEINHYMDLIESFKGEPTNIHAYTSVSASNIICSVIVGRRFEYEDKQFRRLQEIISFNMGKASGTAILNHFPWLRFLPGDIFSCKIMAKNFREFFDIFSGDYIKDNEDIGEAENFIDAYLLAKKKRERKGEKTLLDEPNLMRLILDLIFGGTETVTVTLDWFFLYMAAYPGVQEKVFMEIKDVVGMERNPVLQDRSKLVYLMATIMEVQRLISLLPLSVPRVVARDVHLRGYLIPKGTEILVNFDSILHDPVLWGDDADKFKPERFISKDGSLISPEAWIPFSVGRRVCVGEGIAKMELFLFVSNILQRFKIFTFEQFPIPLPKGKLGLTNEPQPYSISLVSRRKRS